MRLIGYLLEKKEITEDELQTLNHRFAIVWTEIQVALLCANDMRRCLRIVTEEICIPQERKYYGRKVIEGYLTKNEKTIK